MNVPEVDNKHCHYATSVQNVSNHLGLLQSTRSKRHFHNNCMVNSATVHSQLFTSSTRTPLQDEKKK